MPQPRLGAAEIRTLLQTHGLSLTRLSFELFQMSDSEFTPALFAAQLKAAIKVPLVDALLSMLETMSECDHCGAIRWHEPRMLTCSGCRGYHYCDRECQKKNWKGTEQAGSGHKYVCTKNEVSKVHFRMTDTCRKILSALNGTTHNVAKWVTEGGLQDFLYTVAVSDNDLYFIPLPVAVMEKIMRSSARHLGVEVQDRVKAVYEDRGCVVLVVPTQCTNTQGMLGLHGIMLKETFVILPWALASRA